MGQSNEDGGIWARVGLVIRALLALGVVNFSRPSLPLSPFLSSLALNLSVSLS